jgi:hypothetical protein
MIDAVALNLAVYALLVAFGAVAYVMWRFESLERKGESDGPQRSETMVSNEEEAK